MPETVTKAIDLRDAWSAFRRGEDVQTVAARIEGVITREFPGGADLPARVESALDDLVRCTDRDIPEFRRCVKELQRVARDLGVELLLGAP